ncbi:N-acetylmannosamine-6-phosphate epimerase [Ruminiclostridium cellobioparum subsp. termitidis CT1112]|uniref:Putative N-acetylmannosamine-6-phosphate 2-epimerase n=2 Tax=Ruminiclostridium cellobioparum TaxID=29355 RepID=S0FLS0_RUMCE|nr:N-acetylmannosamine-6-phosphate epimerase [Ruminiclostridium cellobioparum subsp. termitidis CT1112]
MVIPEYEGVFMNKQDIFNAIKNGLIVSCQALEDEPLHSSMIMGRMALAASMGGAVGIRANTAEDINEIRKHVDLPIIGIIKQDYPDSDIYITPTLVEVRKLINSAADIIAFDATHRVRPGGETLENIIKEIKAAGKIAMADISTLEEGIAATEKGCDIVSTTMSGYTPHSRQIDEPDYELIYELSSKISIPVIAEGRIFTNEQLVNCFKNGAYSAVIGAAITRPQLITKSFVEALEKYERSALINEQ